VSSDELTAARQRIAGIGLADDLTAALATGAPAKDRRLTDDSAAEAWTAVSKRLRGYAAGRYARTADAGLRDLHTRLGSLLAAVRTAQRDDLAMHVNLYRGIRQAQSALTHAAVGRNLEVEFPDLALRIPLPRLLDFAGAIANIDQAWTSWRDFTRGGSFDPPPWEHDANQPFGIRATAANLRWLASPEAEPWVPTLKQAAQAVAEQMQVEEARHLGLKRPPSGNVPARGDGPAASVVLLPRPSGAS
jgi:hypothetical protein